MKTLTLLRHAKSSWDDPVARDFDRPLNAKGRRAAAMIGGTEGGRVHLRPCPRLPRRPRDRNAGRGVERFGRTLEPVWNRALYLASAASLLDLVQALPDDADHVLMVGHNPGLEDLVLDLTLDGELRERVEDKYPTATVAQMTLRRRSLGGGAGA